MKHFSAVLSPAAVILLAGCGAHTNAAPVDTSGAQTNAATSLKVTSNLDCQAQTQSRNSIQLFPIGLSDNGRTYDMVDCQAVDVVLAHPGTDGCQWTQIQSNNPTVLAVFPLPLPSPPPGGVNEAWIATVPGQATLTSSLACPGGVTAHWAATFIVTL
jgi:hypothetical protein